MGLSTSGQIAVRSSTSGPWAGVGFETVAAARAHVPRAAKIGTSARGAPSAGVAVNGRDLARPLDKGRQVTVGGGEVFELVLELAAAVDGTDVDARFAFRRVPGRLEAAAEGRVGELVQGSEELDVGLEDRAGVRPQPGERIRDPGDPGVGRYVIGDVEIPFTTRRARILIFGVSIGSGSCPTRYGDHRVRAGRIEGGSGEASSGRSRGRTPTGGGAQGGRRREVQRLSLRSSERLEASDQALGFSLRESDFDVVHEVGLHAFRDDVA